MKKLIAPALAAVLFLLSSCAKAPVEPVTLVPETDAVETQETTAAEGESQTSAEETTAEETTAETMTEAPAEESVTVPAPKGIGDLTLEEKVAQLFIIAPEQLDEESVTTLTAAAKEKLAALSPGGFIFFYKNLSTPSALRSFTADLNAACAIPPILSIDEEGGSVARIGNADFGVKTYRSMGAVGDTGDPDKAYEAGATIGAYLRDFGFTLDFAPVADVNSNPDNPVIGRRAFSSDPDVVAEMDNAFISGLHSQGVLACIKHFPGHGDTAGDTHEGFVSLDKSLEELYEVELVPFIANLHNTDMVMVAHVSVEKITGSTRPASLSYEMVTGLLRERLGYRGLIITDSLQMGAVVNTYGAAEAAVLAFEAGNDLLLLPEDYAAAYDAVLAAVKSGRISQARLDESVARILRSKEK